MFVYEKERRVFWLKYNAQIWHRQWWDTSPLCGCVYVSMCLCVGDIRTRAVGKRNSASWSAETTMSRTYKQTHILEYEPYKPCSSELQFLFIILNSLYYSLRDLYQWPVLTSRRDGLFHNPRQGPGGEENWAGQRYWHLVPAQPIAPLYHSQPVGTTGWQDYSPQMPEKEEEKE